MVALKDLLSIFPLALPPPLPSTVSFQCCHTISQFIPSRNVSKECDIASDVSEECELSASDVSKECEMFASDVSKQRMWTVCF